MIPEQLPLNTLFSTSSLDESLGLELDRISRIQDREANNDILRSGSEQLNRRIYGWEDGEIVVVGSRPGMGKTSFALSMVAYPLLEAGKGVGYISLSESKQQIANRVLRHLAGIEAKRMEEGTLMEDELVLIKKLMNRKLPLFINDQPSMSPSKIRELALEMKELYGIRVLIIDYLQVIQGDIARRKRDQEVSDIMIAFKQIAKELEMPIFIQSQLSRAVETRGGDMRPRLSDLKDSGSIEQVADKVIFLYRPDYYGIDPEFGTGLGSRDVAEVILAKNKSGSIGVSILRFQEQKGGIFIDDNEYLKVFEQEDTPF